MNTFNKSMQILQRLNDAGFTSYLVGGCVRDHFLGHEPKDYDIATPATPDDVIKLFEKTIPTGIQHGTVTVVLDGENFEVTTFRVDGHYSDGRRPDSIEFTPSLEEDLKRRDITINAMAMGVDQEIIDLFGGLKDLNNGIIRCVGSAKERFNEDQLRKLRAIRFAARFGFNLHKDIIHELEHPEFLPDLEGVSKERIRDEFNKILMSDGPVYGIQLLLRFPLASQVLPVEFFKLGKPVNNSYHCFDVKTHSILTLNNFPDAMDYKPLEYRIACLLHDVGKANTAEFDEDGVVHYKHHAEESAVIVERWMRDMRYSNDQINLVLKLIRFHDYYIERGYEVSRTSVKRFLRRFDGTLEEALLWVSLREQDIRAQNLFYSDNRLRKVWEVREVIEYIYASDHCFTVKDLEINGDDLVTIGVPKGPIMGVILRSLLELVISYALENEKEVLLERAAQIFAEDSK